MAQDEQSAQLFAGPTIQADIMLKGLAMYEALKIFLLDIR